MENSCFRQSDTVAEEKLRFALLTASCTTNAAATIFAFKQGVVAAAGSCKLSILFYENLNRYASESQRD